MFDAIIAGAGIWGCTVARRLAEAGRRVLVLEQRAAIGGNCRCKTTDGIEVHLYGSHIFHTSNEAVWSFVNRFAKFNDYRHVVLAKTKKCGHKKGVGESGSTADGFHTYHLPIGKTLFEEFFGVPMKDRTLNEFLDEPIDQSAFNLQPSHSTRREALFDVFIRGYTSKQWGVPPEKVDPSVIARLRVRDGYSTDYFDDPHQGIPADGYNAMFGRMLDHPDIRVETEAALRLVGDELRAFRNPDSTLPSFEIDFAAAGIRALPLYYSGPIDRLFNYKFGHLPWRTLRFEEETLPVADFQGNSVVNYTDIEVPFTRIHEFKHYHPEWPPTSKTVVMREYSAAWQAGDEPYYPIATPESAALLARYQSEVDRFNQTINQSNSQTILHVGGRLGAYRYYDMDKSVAAALELDCV